MRLSLLIWAVSLLPHYVFFMTLFYIGSLSYITFRFVQTNNQTNYDIKQLTRKKELFAHQALQKELVSVSKQTDKWVNRIDENWIHFVNLLRNFVSGYLMQLHYKIRSRYTKISKRPGQYYLHSGGVLECRSTGRAFDTLTGE